MSKHNVENFFCDSKDFVEKILAEVIANNNQPSLVQFIRQFFSSMLNHSVFGCNYIELNNIAMELFTLLKTRAPGQINIRIYNPTLKKEGWVSEYSILEIINDDMPFLIDSINEELHQQGIAVFRIIHPTLTVTRNARHELEDILPQDDVNNKPNESVVHCQITKIKSKELCKKIEDSIIDVLSQVRFAVNDFQAIVSQLDQAKKELMPVTGLDLEIIEFLSWLKDDNFIFLGYSSFTYNDKKGGLPHLDKNAALGIFKADDHSLRDSVNNEVVNLLKLPQKVDHFLIDKLCHISKVHRHANLDYIYIRTTTRKQSKIHMVVGLFTSLLSYQSATLIPIIRKKIKQVIAQSRSYPSSYSGKELTTIINNISRDELFQISQVELLNLVMAIYNLMSFQKLRLFIRKNTLGHLISCMILMPSKSFSAELTEKIQAKLSLKLGANVVSTHLQLTNLKLAYINIILAPSPNAHPEINLHLLEHELQELSERWIDNLHFHINNRLSNKHDESLYQHYQNAFPAAYQEKFTVHNAVADIELFTSTLLLEKIVFRFNKNINQPDDTSLELKIYSWQDKIALTTIMPILENMGFKIIDETVFEVKPGNMPASIWLHIFKLAHFNHETSQFAALIVNIENILLKIFLKTCHNDGFNKLVLNAALNWRQVDFVRALSKYIRQTRLIFTQHYIEDVLNKNAHITKLMVDLFYLKFNPAIKRNDKLVTSIEKSIEKELQLVNSSTEDQIIRKFIGTCKAILRTNYFQTDANGATKKYISFKFDSSLVPGLPLPKPYAEIFVYSNHFEAVHLRGEKVARGGIRWSDRGEDFRTEVLGLMRAQMTKNVVIVPVGSKGGFVIKATLEDLGREAYLMEAKTCYQEFLRGILDLTDNIIDDQVVPPKNVVRYDDDDPYLVVAADKGTATFSDLANAVSHEYNFWLGDAFASGGSMGYDHKKMGITAKGAWISVVRHFNELEISLTEDFSVMGIGDMSGDVFGNGMLLSDNIKLLGAFNHLHIFIDPNPDSKISFQERERLFNLPNSNWLDYNSALISTGGFVFDRKSKILELSDQVKTAFDIPDDFVTPDQLINFLLLAKVDLIWNGGIGTYVKATSESHEQAADKANDLLRVNGIELRCKVFAEGGNLGVTQLGRIEYALTGGKINSDAIDNSAGVDCSDHEVNIKIALSKACSSGKLTQESRNSLLESMTDEVASLVLRDNFLQTQAISIAETRGHQDLEKYARLINLFDSKKIFDSKLEYLPNVQEITRRKALKLGMTRPELAVLLAYSKMTIYNSIINTKLPDDVYFSGDLLRYFPNQMKDGFKSEINTHTLKRNIVATSITNSIVNRLGIYFIHFCKDDTGFEGSDIVQIYTLIRDLFNLHSIWIAIESSSCSIAIKSNLFLKVERFLQNNIIWFLDHLGQSVNLNKTIARLAPNVAILSANIEQIITAKATLALQAQTTLLLQDQVSPELAMQILLLDFLSASCDIATLKADSILSTEVLGSIYFQIGEKFEIEWLHSNLEKLYSDSYWQNMAFNALRNDLRNLQTDLTQLVIKFSKTDEHHLEAWILSKSKSILRYENFIQSLKVLEHIDYAMLVVASKNIAALLV